jgi:hypothetical protein
MLSFLKAQAHSVDYTQRGPKCKWGIFFMIEKRKKKGTHPCEIKKSIVIGSMHDRNP